MVCVSLTSFGLTLAEPVEGCMPAAATGPGQSGDDTISYFNVFIIWMNLNELRALKS